MIRPSFLGHNPRSAGPFATRPGLESGEARQANGLGFHVPRSSGHDRIAALFGLTGKRAKPAPRSHFPTLCPPEQAFGYTRPRFQKRRREMLYECKSPEDLLKTIKDNKIEMIDLRFTDVPGLWQHFSVPPRALDHDSIVNGVGFDGSSIRGFQEIQESDMLVIPDPATAFLDPFTEAPTLVLICNIRDPVTGQSYSRDVRYVAQKAENYLTGTGTGDTAYFGPELEHFVFNEVRYDQSTNYGFYEIDAVEANWDAANKNGPGLGHKLRPKEGYFPVPPADALQDTRTNMVSILEQLGIPVEFGPKPP